jgi:hypothetical protein
MRTVDRYIKTKKLSTRVVDGRVWLSKKELLGYRKNKERTAIVDSVDMSTPKMSIDKMVDKVDSIELIEQDFVDNVSTTKRKRETENSLFQKLYNELREELYEKQERLEIANYRVGQLETQIRNSIPMLEYHRENYENEKKQKTLENEIQKYNTTIKKITNQLRYEKLSKRLFVAILMIILALQPLWLLYIYK